MNKLSAEDRAANAVTWINRLSTTRVKQGEGVLGDREQGYCCLGYGCKVFKLDYDPNGDVDKDFKYLVGLKTKNGTISRGHKIGEVQYNTLTHINDSADVSFRKISTVIKSRIDDIFVDEVAKLITQHFNKSK